METVFQFIITLPLLLMLLALVAIVAEIFLPSGGALTVVALGLAVAGVYLAFADYGAWYGFALLLGFACTIPIAIWVGLKLWESTPVGRRLLLEPPSEDEIVSADNPPAKYAHLIGQVARAETPLLPGGTVVIEGRSISAVAENPPIEKGAMVRIVRAENGRVVVRLIEPQSSEGENCSLKRSNLKRNRHT